MSGDDERIIGGFVKAQERLRTARWCIGVLLVATLLFHVYVVYASVASFRDNDMVEFSDAFSEQLMLLAPKFEPQVTDMAHRLYEHYVNVVSDRMERDGPRVKDAIHVELVQLDAHAQDRWPQIEEGILDLFTESEAIIRDELAGELTDEEIEAVVDLYAQATVDYFDDYLQRRFAEHVLLADNIGNHLNAIMEREPNITSPVNIEEALGIMLELAGEELQMGM